MLKTPAVRIVLLCALGLVGAASAVMLPKEPLHRAVLERNVQQVRDLLASGADVNRMDAVYGCTALHLAARQGDLEIVTILRRAGARIYAENRNREPLVFAAVVSGSTNVFAFLVHEGASAKSRKPGGETVLHEAIVCRHPEMAQHLIRMGVDVNARDRKGRTPLHETAYVGDLPVVGDLVQAGADANATTWHKETPLHLAATYNHTNAVAALLGVKADPNRIDDEGNSPLSRTTSPAIAGLLLRAGANPNIADKARYTPLSGAVVHPDGLPMVRSLIAAGADVNQRIDHGRTAIFDAIPGDNVDAFRFLVEHGADLTVRDDSGKTPLDWVETYRAKRIAEYLAGRK
jgi:cytohesin